MNKICPIMSYNTPGSVIVDCKSSCAWYDDAHERCTLVTVAKEIKYISDRIDYVLERN
jgi:hypothetical protein